MRARIVLAVLLLLAGASMAKEPLQTPQPEPRPEVRSVMQRRDWLTRLSQVGHLIKLGSYGRAATMLEELEKTGVPRRDMLTQWVALAAALGDHEEVVALCEEGLAANPRAPRLLRSYAMALMALGRLDGAAAALDRMLEGSPNKTNVVIQSVQLWRDGGHPERGLALCDSVRTIAGVSSALRRPRASCLFDLGRVEEGVVEIVGELEANPQNLSILRQELMPLLRDDDMMRRAVVALDGPSSSAAVTLLRTDLLLQLGRGPEAEQAALPLAADKEGVTSLMRMIATLTREAPLIEDELSRRAVMNWLLTVLETLSTSPAVDVGRRPQVLDMLAGAAESALELGLLDHEPDRAAARLEEVLDRVRRGSPGSSRLYTAQILLARFTRDAQGRPAEAAARLTKLLTNLELPLRGVALCRLELGISHIADCDTSRARVVLRRLGRSTQFPEASGPAHFHLARLDLAQGHWESARDRLAAVALDDPRADHANDALDLALMLAEELERSGGGDALLEAYAPVVAAGLCRRDDERRAALAALLDLAENTLGAVGGSALVDRARLELGALEAAQGRYRQAAELASSVAIDHPDGALAATSLLTCGEWLTAAGDSGAARRAWERLVSQYPDDLSAEDARTLLRELP